jgi:hypothetical protein
MQDRVSLSPVYQLPRGDKFVIAVTRDIEENMSIWRVEIAMRVSLSHWLVMFEGQGARSVSA